MEHVLEPCDKVEDFSIGRNRKSFFTFLHYINDNPASTYVQIRLFCRKENNHFKSVTDRVTTIWMNWWSWYKNKRTFLKFNNVHFNKCCLFYNLFLFLNYVSYNLNTSRNIGSSRNNSRSFKNKSNVFHVRLHCGLKKSFYRVFEALGFQKVDNFDGESNLLELAWVNHSELEWALLQKLN